MSDSKRLESYDEMIIAYKSQEGEISLRRILPLEYYSIGDKNYVRAYCYLKQAERTFRLDRIISINSVANTNTVSFINDMPLNNSELSTNIIKSKPENNITFNAPIPYSKPLYKAYEAKEKEKEKKPFSYVKLLFIAFCMFFVLKCYNDQHTPTPKPPTTPTQVNKPAILTSTPVEVEKKTTSLPETKTVYHGYSLWLYKNGDYTEAVIPRFGTNRLKLQDAYAKINEAWFFDRYAWGNAAMFTLFQKVDRNLDGEMSWTELASFQSSLYNTWSYLENETALRPDDFFAQGGGDCEDWALVTAALCHYWGWEAYIGSFRPKSGSGHAICLVRSNSKTAKAFTHYYIKDFLDFEDIPLPDGNYIPIDYDHVGSLSNAVGKGWLLKTIYRSETLYGETM